MKTTFEIDKTIKSVLPSKIKAEQRFYSMLKRSSNTRDIFTREYLFNVSEVMEVSKFSYKTVAEDIDTGELKFMIRGKTKYIALKELARYIGIDSLASF